MSYPVPKFCRQPTAKSSASHKMRILSDNLGHTCFFPHLSLADLCTLLKVDVACRYFTHRYMKASMRCETMTAAFFTPEESDVFWNTVVGSRSLVSGSAVVHYLSRTSFGSFELDVICPFDSYHTMESFLMGIGYISTEEISRASSGVRSENCIMMVCVFSRCGPDERSSVVNVHVAAGDAVEGVLKSQSSILMNFTDGFFIISCFPFDSFQLRDIIEFQVYSDETNYFEPQRIKYTDLVDSVLVSNDSSKMMVNSDLDIEVFWLEEDEWEDMNAHYDEAGVKSFIFEGSLDEEGLSEVDAVLNEIVPAACQLRSPRSGFSRRKTTHVLTDVLSLFYMVFACVPQMDILSPAQGDADSGWLTVIVKLPCDWPPTVGSFFNLEDNPHVQSLLANVALPVIASFSNLTVFVVTYAYFPLNEICSFVSRFPALVTLELSYLAQDWARNEPALLGGCNPFTRDNGFEDLGRLVSLPGLQQITVSLDTFLDLVTTLSITDTTFSPTVTTLRVRTVASQYCDVKLLKGQRVANMMRASLSSCAPVPQHLDFFTTESILRPKPTLFLPKLVEYIGSHEFLCGLRFSASLKTLWVPAYPYKQSTLWRMSKSFVDDCSSLDIAALRVQGWSVSDTPLGYLFSVFRNARQLGVEMNIPVSKKWLLRLSDHLANSTQLREISLVLSSKRVRLSLKDEREIVAAWKKVCPSLVRIRLDRHYMYHWDEDTCLWTHRMNDVEWGALPDKYSGVNA
ncbi:hypothetical protein AAF712_011016 [Marasmius tenuissimus]|uniref:F-box domain-containing protein n=1 Tax=Marasmius tenuissimus TaxID=585030 RepID=A0ABR2ZLK9_9AGAR